jgi:UDP-2,3-diacylglucosamine pyrophosphatase LpxH
MSKNNYNYLFVSDFHIAMGVDPIHKIVNPREDFLYDDEFFRFLRWADKKENREDDKPWELVFVGDCFDFLPVDITWNKEYEPIVKSLEETITTSDKEVFTKTWQHFLYASLLPIEMKMSLFSFFLKNELLEITKQDKTEEREITERMEIKQYIKRIPRIQTQAEQDMFTEDEFEKISILQEKDKRTSKKNRTAQVDLEFSYEPNLFDIIQPKDFDPLNEEDRDFQRALTRGWLRIPPWADEMCARHYYGKRKYKKHLGKSNYFIDTRKSLKNKGNLAWFYRLRLRLRRENKWEQYKYQFYKEDASCEKLRLIYNGHPQFFKALAWWVGSGHRLVIMTGNHDIEISWPKVQESFKDMLVHDFYDLNLTNWAKTQKSKKNIKNPPEVPEDFILDFRNRIDFSRPWFYYKPGMFYAQHGAQYDNVNSAVNLLKPFRTKKNNNGKNEEWLNPSFGNLGNPIVSSLEDYYPEWDNVGSHSTTLSYLIHEYPGRFTRIIATNMWQYARMAWELYKDSNDPKAKSEPDIKQLKDYKNLPGNEKLEEEFLQILYTSWDKPLMLRRGFLILIIIVLHILAPFFWLINILLKVFKWLFYSKSGLALVIIGVVLLVAIPGVMDGLKGIYNTVKEWWEDNFAGVFKFLTSIIGVIALRYLIGGFVDPLKKKLKRENKKFFQYMLYGQDYIRVAARQTYNVFADWVKCQKLPANEMPRFYIFGHDHEPYKAVLSKGDYWNDEPTAEYINTGSWLSSFSKEDVRRLRTGGGDLEFTFFKVWKYKTGVNEMEVKGELLRWDDEAERIERQIVIAAKGGDGITD